MADPLEPVETEEPVDEPVPDVLDDSALDEVAGGTGQAPAGWNRVKNIND
jgi:hypothetical protein